MTHWYKRPARERHGQAANKPAHSRYSAAPGHNLGRRFFLRSGRPDFPLDELDGVAGGVADVDRPCAGAPGHLAFDLDAFLREAGRPEAVFTGIDPEGDVARAL